jgi:hypothetical protein
MPRAFDANTCRPAMAQRGGLSVQWQEWRRTFKQHRAFIALSAQKAFYGERNPERPIMFTWEAGKGIGAHLVLHQTDEWRDDDARLASDKRWNLIADALARSGCLEDCRPTRAGATRTGCGVYVQGS